MNDELREMREGVTEIRLQVGKLVDHMDGELAHREKTDASLQDLKAILVGDGRDPGLVHKVRSLEQTQQTQRKMAWLFATPIIGLIAKAAVDFYSNEISK